ncbi:hypothetical protein RF11_10067 [Thelohanellus kitauei]|uniref:Uncharacterized protein n=1 Tax=Thelohanellus kitauei TaxID=669202 RepID=A0A0C2NIM0_THEKT|nr:hypothetical protein RF11_10067 [Thelohanellus kitauei]
MKSNLLMKQFKLNVQLVESVDEESRCKGNEWMNSFEESALTTCYNILNSSVDDIVKTHSVKAIRNKICFIFEALFKRVDVWEGSLSQILDDIFMIDGQPSEYTSQYDGSLYPQKVATIFLKQFLCDRQSFKGSENTKLERKISRNLPFLNKLISKLIKNFQTDPFLDEIIEMYRLKTRAFPSQNILECSNFLMIRDILKNTCPKEWSRAYRCVKAIKTCVKQFEVLSLFSQLSFGNQIEPVYTIFATLVQEIRKFVPDSIDHHNEKLFGMNNSGLCTLRVLWQGLEE